MRPEFAEHVDAAEQIRTSGRWAAVNASIERFAANPGADNAWYVQLLGSLCGRVFSEYWLLKSGYADRKVGVPSLLAWRARNMLELSVWSTYCSLSRENARRLYEDAGRDVLDVYSAFEKWGSATVQGAEWVQMFNGAKDDVTQRAASEGIETLDGSYKQVSAAARECGMGVHFGTTFKMLSKFAHPTAMQILSSPDDATYELQRDCFFGLGCLYFTGAFVALECKLIESGSAAV